MTIILAKKNPVCYFSKFEVCKRSKAFQKINEAEKAAAYFFWTYHAHIRIPWGGAPWAFPWEMKGMVEKPFNKEEL
ncbi:MAG: hypothetical protein AABY87_05040 [bacterium]